MGRRDPKCSGLGGEGRRQCVSILNKAANIHRALLTGRAEHHGGHVLGVQPGPDIWAVSLLLLRALGDTSKLSQQPQSHLSRSYSQ